MPQTNSARMKNARQEDVSGKGISSFIRGTDPDINARRVGGRLVRMQGRFLLNYASQQS